MARSGNKQPAIDQAEHIGPIDTGDNIEAKRVVPYGWDGTNWQRQALANPGLITSSYDYVGVTYPDTTTDVFTFKTGGSGGTTVGVVTITYTDDTKASMTSVTKT